MGRGPGHLLIPNVNYAISTTALHAAIGSLYPDFKPGETRCDFVELGKGGGLGVRFWVPHKEVAARSSCQVLLGFLKFPVEDGDLRMTTAVQEVFRKGSASRRRKNNGVVMGTPTSKRMTIARKVGLFNLNESDVAVSTSTVASLLKDFKGIEVAPKRRDKDKGALDQPRCMPQVDELSGSLEDEQQLGMAQRELEDRDQGSDLEATDLTGSRPESEAKPGSPSGDEDFKEDDAAHDPGLTTPEPATESEMDKSSDSDPKATRSYSDVLSPAQAPSPALTRARGSQSSRLSKTATPSRGLAPQKAASSVQRGRSRK
jgi:hypothetical protein